MEKRESKSVIVLILVATILLKVLFCSSMVFATNNTTYISLSDESIIVNGESITTDSSTGIYLTKSMNNGGNSDEAKKANIEIMNVININSSGIYEFTGNLSDGQIAVNANEIDGEVIIILNNVDITCKNAPAIFVYSTDTNSSSCTVIIKTETESTNVITGGKIKQSVEGWEDQENLSYYVEKGYDDDKTYYERYKYDGAISSDLSLTFEGEGTLTVNAVEKEGIESKRNITINSGNYRINSLDDGINACTDNESVITINGGSVLVNVLEDAEEGDGIDSNGSIYINGGNVYAFACEASQDNGLDADSGIYINSGYVVATGNMADTISNDSKQEFMQLQFTSKIAKSTLITITNEDKRPIVAFESDRTYSVLTISTPELGDGEHYVYEGGQIEGISENGLYTQITSYEEGTIKEYRMTTDNKRIDEFENSMNRMDIQSNNRVYYYVLSILGILLIVLIIVAIMLKKNGKIWLLVMGILIGAIITTVVFFAYNNIHQNYDNNRQEMKEEQIPNNGEIPEGEALTKPNANENK